MDRWAKSSSPSSAWLRKWSWASFDDRQRAGIEAAKAKGVYKGRPVKLDWNRIKQMDAEGKGPTEISKTIGCSRGMIYKVLYGTSKRQNSPLDGSASKFQGFFFGRLALPD